MSVKNSFAIKNILFNDAAYNAFYLSFLFERKFLYMNINQRWTLEKVHLSFSNKNLSTNVYLGLIANFFFLKLFTGKQPFFLPVKVVSSFKRKSYTFTCISCFSKKKALTFLLLTLAFASYNINTSDFSLIPSKCIENSIVFVIKNFPYMRIIETHPVFFKWNCGLDISIDFNNAISNLEKYHILLALKIQPQLLLVLL